MKRTLLENIIFEARLDKPENIENAQGILLNYLKNNPKDTDAWLLLMRLEYSGTEDPEKMAEYANQVLIYDSENPSALLFLSFTDYFACGSYEEALYSKLIKGKTNDPEMLAMLEVAKAYYWEKRDLNKCIAALKKSIEYSQKQRINLCMLGEIYIQQRLDHKQTLEGAELIKRGLNNVKLIADEETPYDPTSISDFFAEFFAGTIIGIVEYEILKKLISIDETNDKQL
jgi:hypothetical protein